MRRSNIKPLGEVIREYLKGTGYERKLKEVDVVQSWEELLGKTITHYTTDISIKNKVLYVKISSPVVKNELFMMREEIRRKLNEGAGEEIVSKIVFK